MPLGENKQFGWSGIAASAINHNMAAMGLGGLRKPCILQ
jgi:hypothetical protein